MTKRKKYLTVGTILLVSSVLCTFAITEKTAYYLVFLFPILIAGIIIIKTSFDYCKKCGNWRYERTSITKKQMEKESNKEIEFSRTITKLKCSSCGYEK